MGEWAAGRGARSAMQRSMAPRMLAVAVLGLLHMAIWQLITSFPSAPAPPAALRSTPAATLRLLTGPRAPQAPVSADPQRSEASVARQPEMPAQRAVDSIPWHPPAAALQSEHGPSAPLATAPAEPAPSAPLDLRLRADPGSLRELMEAAQPLGEDRRELSVGGISDRDMGEGRRRIVIRGSCYDTRPSRAAELGLNDSGFARDLQLVKPCQ